MIKSLKMLTQFAILAALLGAACACEKKPDAKQTETTIGSNVDDSITTAKIKAEFLKDDRIKSLDISVNTTHGEATLSGQVDDARQIEIAGDLTRTVDGVVRVKNLLVVKQRESSDEMITDQVRSALQGDADLKKLAILVSTKDGEVRLSGLVENQAQVRRSVAVAQRVPGVRSVIDQLQVR